MKMIGTYKELCPNHPELDSILDHVDNGMYPEKAALIEYILNAGKNAISCNVILTDAIDGKSKIYGCARVNDGVYEWITDIAFYIEKYNLRPDEDFVAHVIHRTRTKF